MYFVLLNEIAQAQSSSTPVTKPQPLETVSGNPNASDPTPADESAASHQPSPKLAIGQIQSGQEGESTLAPDHYQWHNGNRNEDKIAQEYLESLQHQFIQATNVANKLTNARAIVEKNCAIQHWTTAAYA